MAGFAPQLQGGVGYVTPTQQGAGGLGSLAALSGFLEAPQERTPSSDERNAALWQQYSEQNFDGVSIGSATMSQLRQFSADLPQAGSWVMGAASDQRNQSLHTVDQDISIQDSLQQQFLTSPAGIIATGQAASMEPVEAQRFLARAMAEQAQRTLDSEETARRIQEQGLTDTLRDETWTQEAYSMRQVTGLISEAMTDAVQSMVMNPGSSINLGEIPGLVAMVPQLQGTVLTRQNAPEVMRTFRAAFIDEQTRRIARQRGVDPGQLGVMPDSVANDVFRQFDVTATWITESVDPATIVERSKDEGFMKLIEAGVPVDIVSSLAMASNGNPALQAAIMGTMTGSVGDFMTAYNNGEFEVATQQALDMSRDERDRAFAGLSELARVWSGTSSTANVYEEVNTTTRNVNFASTTLAAMEAANASVPSGESPVYGRNWYRQNIEATASSFAGASQAVPTFAPTMVRNLSGDLNTHYNRIRNDAEAIGARVVIGSNGALQLVPTQASQARIESLQRDIENLQNGTVQLPGGGDTSALIQNYQDEINTLSNPTLEGASGQSLTDLQYKWNVLGNLGDIGRQVRTLATNEFDLGRAGELADQVESTLAETAGQVTAGGITTSTLGPDYGNMSGAALIREAERNLGLNENQQNDVLRNYLASGGVNIDPAETAWCAGYVNSVLRNTGLDGTQSLAARSFLEWGTAVDTPQLGDIVVLSRGDNPAQGHVGFFKGFDENGNILILGGNQGDTVSVASFSPDRLLGYRRAPGIEATTDVAEQERILGDVIYRAGSEQGFLPASVPSAPSAQQTSAQPQQPEPLQTVQSGAFQGGQGENATTDRSGGGTSFPRPPEVDTLPVNQDTSASLREISATKVSSLDSQSRSGVQSALSEAANRAKEGDRNYEAVSEALRENPDALDPENVLFAGDLSGWEEGIRSGAYKVGDVVVYNAGGRYTVTVIREYDVRTIRGSQ